jgi:protein TonB
MGRNHEEKPAEDAEIAYETFSEPPAPTPVVKPVAKAPEPETPDEPDDKTPDTAPKELHDDSSTVAGTQAAPKPQQVSTGAQGVGDAATTPYYKIKPKYPQAALVSGIEGWVLLKVDIKENGEVENVRVVGGQQRNLFQDEARRAVQKWKYKPSTRKTDYEIRVDFKLQDA